MTVFFIRRGEDTEKHREGRTKMEAEPGVTPASQGTLRIARDSQDSGREARKESSVEA